MPPPAKVPTPVILAWLRDNPGRTATDAARHFGVPDGTIRAALKRERDAAASRGNLTVLERPAPAPDEPDPALALMSTAEKVRIAIGLRVDRFARPIDPREESVADSSKIMNALLDRLPAIEALEAVKELDPTTAEGRAALLEALASFPADLLAEAAGKRAG